MTSRLFEEPEIGLVAHNSVSRQMAVDDSLAHWIQYLSNTVMPTAAKHVEATVQWPNSRQVNNTAHNIAFNHDVAYFDYVSQDASRAIEFARTMQAVSNTDSFDNCHLVKSLDWSSLGEALVVDVRSHMPMECLLYKLTATRWVDPLGMPLSPWRKSTQI